MSVFKNLFGKKDSSDKTASGKKAAESRAVDFTEALSMHLRGEIEPALDAYLRIAGELPDDNLAPFFAAAIKAGKGEVVQAAESLRTLSGNIASRGDVISRAIVLDVAAVASDMKIAAVAEISGSLAERLKKEGFVKESVVCLEIAAGLAPDNANVLHRFADTLHDLRIYDYAEKVLLEALRIAPNHWGALYTYAVLLQDLGRDEEALPYYEKAAKFDPTHAKCRNNYGAALLRTNRVEEALVQCTAAAELDPASPLVKINLGNIHMLLQQYETARTCFAEAISLNGNLAPAHFGLGRIEELSGGDPASIRQSYLTAVQLNPSLAEIHPALKSLVA